LIGDARLDCIVGLRLDQNSANKIQNLPDAVWRLPLITAKDAETHGAFVVVGDIRVVDFGPEGDDGRLEWVFPRKRDLELKLAALDDKDDGSALVWCRYTLV
jgi:hypothetical protein